MRLDIRYRMFFDYDQPVREAHNELRVRPKDSLGQRLLAHRLSCDPQARILSFTDYWGTNVDHLGVVFEHDTLELVAEAAVETRDRAEPSNGPRPHADDGDHSLDNVELLVPSPHVAWNGEITSIARDATAGLTDIISTVEAAVAATRSILSYERSSTRIGIPLDELVAGGKGVCQDYAHLTIGLLRAVGVPARYVSGYLFAADESATGLADQPRPDQIVSVQTHAWVEAGLPDGEWLAVDPTNDRPVGQQHVIIGYGRDYDDVAPVRGVYAGFGRPTVEATVEIRHMEPVERTMSPKPRRRDRAMSWAPIADTFEAQQQQQ